jgi:ribosomal protein L7/L12
MFKQFLIIEAQKTGVIGELLIKTTSQSHTPEPEEVIGIMLYEAEKYEEIVHTVVEMIGLAHRINCVKYVKRLTGLGLKESKDLVDKLYP